VVKDSTYLVPRLVSEMQYSPIEFYLDSTSVQEGSTPATGTEEKEGAPLGVSSKGGAPFLERDSLQVIGRAFGDSITWVFIAGIGRAFGDSWT
jgi:hypothetical protein